ncbi:DinB family protein [Gelidibacter salicanalis]|uniref:DinB family protein n=1 Tax=Gelidibacter salicanalis TaxID=291193 RepID=A0A934NJ97_9FLAO|nr:DinB family protein [Gelidibacter salicanalis]MBJ7881069.1 DinB family protein [Gelidibacter salicanalis]
MHKDEIADLLEEKYHNLLNWLEVQDEDKWLQGPEGKWTTGQQALHLLQSIKPLNDVLSMPRFWFKYAFGINNRDLRDYDMIVQRYLERLEEFKKNPAKASKKLKVPKIKDKKYILTRLQVESKKLQYKTRRISDKNLDTLVLPHPIMGKMPIRELLMWTAYHAEHHTKQLQKMY